MVDGDSLLYVVTSLCFGMKSTRPLRLQTKRVRLGGGGVVSTVLSITCETARPFVWYTIQLSPLCVSSLVQTVLALLYLHYCVVFKYCA
jgi:hypothetical protein